MKKLITEKIIEECVKNHETEILIDTNTLITPSARDIAKNVGVKLVYEKQDRCSCTASSKSACCDQGNTFEISKETLVRAVLEVLNEKGLLK